MTDCCLKLLDTIAGPDDIIDCLNEPAPDTTELETKGDPDAQFDETC